MLQESRNLMKLLVLRSADKHLLVVPDTRSETGRRTIIVTPTVWNSLSMYEYPINLLNSFRKEVENTSFLPTNLVLHLD